MSTHIYSREYLRKWSKHLFQEVLKEEDYTPTPGSTKGRGVQTYSRKYLRKRSTHLLQEILKEEENTPIP